MTSLIPVIHHVPTSKSWLMLMPVPLNGKLFVMLNAMHLSTWACMKSCHAPKLKDGGNLWVFCIKRNLNCTIQKQKA